MKDSDELREALWTQALLAEECLAMSDDTDYAVEMRILWMQEARARIALAELYRSILVED